MQSQPSKAFIGIILTFVFMENGSSTEWISDESDSQFLDDIDFGIGSANEENDSLSKILPEFARRRHNILVKKGLPPMYKISSNGPACSCIVNYHPVDLGRGYLPRYIQMGKCHKDSCGKHHRCLEKKYKIKVFKRKNVDTLMSLQKNFQDFWSVEAISVAVACECVAEFQMVFQK